MGSLTQQILAVSRLNLASIPQRFWMSLATIVAVALVVAVLLTFLAMAEGFRKTVASTGSDDVAVALRAGSNAELSSTLMAESVRLLEQAPGVAQGPDGPISSAELYVIVDGYKRATNTEANLPFRGVSPDAIDIRGGITIAEGRMFEPGTNEMIVGRAVTREFAGFDLGETITLRQNEWTVVGIFEMNGSVFESEIWADALVLQSLFQRGASFQSVRLKLDGPDALETLKAYAEEEPRLNVDINSEKEFYAEQSSNTDFLVNFIGWPISIAMAIGALAGALNTMYASVDSRTREIATLRAIGFGGFPAFMGTIFEALFLSALGGLVGAVATFLIFANRSASTLGSGFTQVVFSFNVGPSVILNGLFLALIVGFIGGFLPAIRAARTSALAANAG